MSARRIHLVYKVLNKPLTILGADRRLFFSALILGAAAFNLFSSLLAGLVLFIALLIVAKSMTAKDRQFPRILLNSSKFKKQYDPLKFHIYIPKVIHHA